MSLRSAPIFIVVLVVLAFAVVGCAAAEEETTTTLFQDTTTVTLPPGTPEAVGEDGGRLTEILGDPRGFDGQEVSEVVGIVALTFEDDPHSFVMGIPGIEIDLNRESPDSSYYILVLGEEGAIPEDIEVGQTAEVDGIFQFYTGHAIIGEANPLGWEAWDGRPVIVADQVTIRQ